MPLYAEFAAFTRSLESTAAAVKATLERECTPYITAVQRYRAAQMSHRKFVFHLARYIAGARDLRNTTELAIEAATRLPDFLIMHASN